MGTGANVSVKLESSAIWSIAISPHKNRTVFFFVFYGASPCGPGLALLACFPVVFLWPFRL